MVNGPPNGGSGLTQYLKMSIPLTTTREANAGRTKLGLFGFWRGSVVYPGDTITTAVADGNWVLLKPFAPGEHELSFKGFVKESVSSRDDRSAYDIDLKKDLFDFPSGWNHMATYNLSITI